MIRVWPAARWQRTAAARTVTPLLTLGTRCGAVQLAPVHAVRRAEARTAVGQPHAAPVLPTVASRALRWAVVEIKGAATLRPGAEALGTVHAVLAELAMAARAPVLLAMAARFAKRPGRGVRARRVSRRAQGRARRPAAHPVGLGGAIGQVGLAMHSHSSPEGSSGSG